VKRFLAELAREELIVTVNGSKPIEAPATADYAPVYGASEQVPSMIPDAVTLDGVEVREVVAHA